MPTIRTQRADVVSMTRTETAELLGLLFDTVTIETAVARCLELCHAPRISQMVITVNASHLCMMRQDPELARACNADRKFDRGAMLAMLGGGR